MQTLLHDPIQKLIAERLSETIAKVYPDADTSSLDAESIYNLFSDPPNLKMGHIAFGCFPLP